MRHRLSSWLTLLSCVAANACGPATVPADARVDAPSSDAADGAGDRSDVRDATPTGCTLDSDCSDTIFCNGEERCAPGATGADARGCVAANPANPCATSQQCDESQRRCLSMCDQQPDADGDGHRAIACGGDDCDDADAMRYPGNPEVCDGAMHDEDCDAMTYANAATMDGDLDRDGEVNRMCCNTDRSGMRYCGTDCDDADPNIYRTAPEVCNGRDDNCNAMIDEGVQRRFYADVDGDGYGDPASTPMSACDPPTGFVESRTDCDDTDSMVNPAAAERCNGTDDNCNGTIDESLAVHTFYPDADGDGRGSSSATAMLGCSVPAGSVENNVDCDDAQGSVYGFLSALLPAAPEICDGRDNDCNGTADENPAASTASCTSPRACFTGMCVAPAEVAVGGAHACARWPGGAVSCWGRGSEGEIGDPSLPTFRGTPDLVAGLTGTTQLALGERFSCALRGDSRVVCWGDNSSGELGDGTTTTSATPVVVAGITNAVQIAASNFHACARLLDGTIRCWGSNSSGEAGNGTSGSSISTPVAVSGITNATDIALGGYHTCAVLATNTIRCWGWNIYGQLGDNTTTDRTTPVPILAPAGASFATDIAAGFQHTCARAGTNTLYCWGRNRNGQIGDTTVIDRPAPTQVASLSGTDLVAGSTHSCARVAGGGTYCWGNNSSGQLGNGMSGTAAVSMRVSVSSLVDGVALAAGGSETCALRAAGPIVCWGANASGQIGDGTTTARSLPTETTGLP